VNDGNDSLQHYRKKRDFRKTPEPRGDQRQPGTEPIFVIQKHQARTLHYDFRIEVNGVLKSWAVPKGPSTDPREKRLALPTEDHPLDYADFEGTIPEDEYGAGAVIVWDIGTYRNLKDEGPEPVSMEQALEQGHVTIWVEGRKLRGGYAFIHTKGGKENQWLLIKMDDDGADARRKPVNTEPESVLTGKTLEDIAQKAKDE
jgi:DNA ligase D-like protein (predicted 3'-phosphoesterase)